MGQNTADDQGRGDVYYLFASDPKYRFGDSLGIPPDLGGVICRAEDKATADLLVELHAERYANSGLGLVARPASDFSSRAYIDLAAHLWRLEEIVSNLGSEYHPCDDRLEAMAICAKRLWELEELIAAGGKLAASDKSVADQGGPETEYFLRLILRDPATDPREVISFYSLRDSNDALLVSRLARLFTLKYTSHDAGTQPWEQPEFDYTPVAELAPDDVFLTREDIARFSESDTSFPKHAENYFRNLVLLGHDRQEIGSFCHHQAAVWEKQLREHKPTAALGEARRKADNSSQSFYLYASSEGTPKMNCGTVFYKVKGQSLAESLCGLFRKEYSDNSGCPTFLYKDASSVPLDEQVLLDETLDELWFYDDPDRGVYDPPPPREMHLRAQYAHRAQRLEERLRHRMDEGQSDEGDAPNPDELPQMSPEERQNSGLILLMLLAQAYYKMLECTISMASWCGALDIELNQSYLWTVQNLTNLLKNHGDLRDFPMEFEPLFPDLYPSTIRDCDWEDMVAPEAERFLSTVQQYVHSRGIHDPEEGSPSWVFIEMFRPSINTAIEEASAYHKRMRQHRQRLFGSGSGSAKDKPEAALSSTGDRPAEPQAAGGDEEGTPHSPGTVTEQDAPPTKSSRKRGRPRDTDPEKDKRIYDAWQSAHYSTYAGLAKELPGNMKAKDVRRAIDRHRHRMRRKE